VKRLFVSDCEGPISKNDNAYELAEKFIPNGDRFFANVSKYDDVLADVFRKPGYTAGSTLRLVLPFFKAYGVTDKIMEDFSAQNILLIAGSQTTLQHILEISDPYIVSTSYEHYIRALCKAVDFGFKRWAEVVVGGGTDLWESGFGFAACRADIKGCYDTLDRVDCVQCGSASGFKRLLRGAHKPKVAACHAPSVTDVVFDDEVGNH